MPVLLILNDDPQNFSITYNDNGDLARRAALAAQWKRIERKDPNNGTAYSVWYRNGSSTTQTMVDRRMPPTAPAGRYRVETFVPALHATSRKALFTVACNFRKTFGQVQHDEPVRTIDLLPLHDEWVSLGDYDLDPATYPLSGRVRQYDLSQESPVREVSFGPVRYTPLVPITPAAPTGARFDSPVGTEQERNAIFPTGGRYGGYPVWDGLWFDANPFLSWYSLGCHTGADLNLPGASGADKDKPVYSIGDGTVIYSGSAGTWGNIIVIEHPSAQVTLPNGKTQAQSVISRYGHLSNNLLVRRGQSVKRGQNLGFIGLPPGSEAGWHLHFDICYSGLLKSRPAHWPNLSTIQSYREDGISTMSDAYKKAKSDVEREVLANYLDPLKFIRENHNA